jgi:ammonia channel protein AmtB
MRFKWSTKWLLFPGLGIIAFLVAVFLVDAFTHRVEYPLDIWRMDLDDFLGNIGFLLAGIAAIWTVAKTAKRAEKKADQVADQVNGGMASLATQILHDEIRVAGLEVGLGARVMALEESKRDCEEEKRVCLEENEKLRDWVIERLDTSGNGRKEGR